MAEDDDFERILDDFKEIFNESITLKNKEEVLTNIINKIVSKNLYDKELTNYFALVSNIIKIIIEERILNVNHILSILIKYTTNYIGLLLIGMVFHMGANPNVYYNYNGQNLHILCILSIRRGNFTDPFYRYINNLLRMLGSDINYLAINIKDSDDRNLDVNYVEDVIKNNNDLNVYSGMTVSQYVREQGKLPDEDIEDFLNSISSNMLLHIITAVDNVELFDMFTKLDYFKEIFNDGEESINPVLKLFLNISTAGSLSIANEITDKIIPFINKTTINTQTIPIYASIIASDYKLFKLLAAKGASIKYVSITQIIANYKKFKNMGLSLYKNNFKMLLDSVNIGADIDLYQFEFFISSADYEEIEEIKKAYDVPKWKKLCAVVNKTPRQEIKQIAFELNIPYNQSEEQMCNKFKQISLLDKNQFLESAVNRQEDRINTDLAAVANYPYNKNKRYRCSAKSMVINNPYAYNDTRMAFYLDPETDEVECFTADIFPSLIASRINDRTGKPLPDGFIENLKAQVAILTDMGLFNYNNTMKDTLKEYFDRSVINNKKSDYAYNSVIKILGLYGISEDRFNTLGAMTLSETILNEIAGVKLNFFEVLSPRNQVMLTARVIYSISKNLKTPSEFYDSIGRAVNGNTEDTTINNGEENAISEYMAMLE
jgi:hypothetical protein